MKEISLKELKNKTKEWQSTGNNWHFHMLAPNCFFNKKKNKHAFVIENDSNKEIYVYHSNKRLMKLGKDLLKKIYGISILEQKNHKTNLENKKIANILKRAKFFNQERISWHHHMLLPNCFLNKNKGKWVIFFEDPKENKNIKLIYNKEPLNDLRKIEILYYQQSA